MATFLPREEWAQAQGKKVESTALRLRRSRRSRSSARSSHQRGHVRPRAEPQFKAEDLAYLGCAAQEVETVRRRKRNNLPEKAVMVREKSRSRERVVPSQAMWSRTGNLLLAQSGPTRGSLPRSGKVIHFNMPLYVVLFDEEGVEAQSPRVGADRIGRD